jgi:hypothetical protein
MHNGKQYVALMGGQGTVGGSNGCLPEAALRLLLQLQVLPPARGGVAPAAPQSLVLLHHRSAPLRPRLLHSRTRDCSSSACRKKEGTPLLEQEGWREAPGGSAIQESSLIQLPPSRIRFAIPLPSIKEGSPFTHTSK